MFARFKRYFWDSWGLTQRQINYSPTRKHCRYHYYLFTTARDEDIPAMVDIERQIYGRAPWNRLAFEEELGRANRLYLVVKDDDKVVAYAGCDYYWRRRDAHITNIAVMPTYQHCGIGTELMMTQMEVASRYQLETMSLEVRVENAAAKRLYHRLGFRDGRVKYHYYDDDHGDALDMVAKLEGGSNFDKADFNTGF